MPAPACFFGPKNGPPLPHPPKHIGALNLHQIDEKESFKHLLFTAPNSLLLAITNLTLFISSFFSTILGLKVMGGRL